MSEDSFYMGYQNKDRKLSVKFEGFGVTNINKLQEHPDYDKWTKAVEVLAKEIFDLE